MKQQTAVEWLQEQLECFGNKHELQMSWTTLDELFDQAKEMEKEQMIDAIIFSEREHYIMGECWPTQTVIDEAERYYNETFKTNK